MNSATLLSRVKADIAFRLNAPVKVCTQCKNVKDKAMFHKTAGNFDGLARTCKECCRVRKLKFRNTDEYRSNRLIANRKKLAKARYRERKNQCVETSTLTPSDVAIIFERFGDKCFNCDSRERLTLDHHMPIKAGYSLTYSNAVALCYECNSAKQDKLPTEFYSADKLAYLNGKLGIGPPLFGSL